MDRLQDGTMKEKKRDVKFREDGGKGKLGGAGGLTDSMVRNICGWKYCIWWVENEKHVSTVGPRSMSILLQWQHFTFAMFRENTREMASAAAELVVEREPEPMREMVDGNRTTFVGAQGLVKLALEQYTEILASASDPRVGNWPLMESPIPTVVIVLLYLYSVTIAGPRMMSNKKPYNLRNVLIAYNAVQVIFSLGMLYEHLMSGWLLDYSYKCQPVDYSHNPSALRMANLCWWYFISKFTEFADTVFFVLRKKKSQVTFLHLYHHSLTPLETWICVKFIPGGHGTLGNLINNAVHVVMYAYYMLAAMGPEYKKYLWWKKHLTTIQLIQFFLVFVHSAQALIFDCGYPKLVAILLLLHSAIFFVLFSDFYRRAYRRTKSIDKTKVD